MHQYYSSPAHVKRMAALRLFQMQRQVFAAPNISTTFNPADARLALLNVEVPGVLDVQGHPITGRNGPPTVSMLTYVGNFNRTRRTTILDGSGLADRSPMIEAINASGTRWNFEARPVDRTNVLVLSAAPVEKAPYDNSWCDAPLEHLNNIVNVHKQAKFLVTRCFEYSQESDKDLFVSHLDQYLKLATSQFGAAVVTNLTSVWSPEVATDAKTVELRDKVYQVVSHNSTLTQRLREVCGAGADAETRTGN